MTSEQHACELPVPVRVDPQTGAWSVDGQPMVLVPRHYWAFIQQSLEDGLGLEKAHELLSNPGYRAAKVWCERESATHGLRGGPLFRHYMQRMSERGYGAIRIEALDLEAGTADVRIEHSVYPAEYGLVNRCVCYRFEGPLEGSVEYCAATEGRTLKLQAREVACVSAGASECRFDVRPA